jgi:phage shock protein A
MVLVCLNELGFCFSHALPSTHHSQGDLVKVRQSYAEVTATQRRQMKQKEQASALSEDWYKRAQLALQKGNEELAREALSRRQQNTDEAESLQQQIDFQAASIDKLYEGMQVLEKKIMESKSKKEQMVARARTAQSTQKVNDMLGGLTGKTSMDAFNRMEDKVEALEAAAEVSSEMGALTGSAPASLEAEFKLLEGGASVDEEMRKLKGLLGGSSTSGTEASSSSSSSTDESTPPPPAANSPVVDDEFEKLKKEAGL